MHADADQENAGERGHHPALGLAQVQCDTAGDKARPELAYGDSGNRPWGWPTPRLLRRAHRRGLRLLPGSDPLPLPSEVRRAGRFGFAVEGALSPEKPAADLLRRLREPRTPVIPFGHPETPWRFLRNQVLLRVG